jgi:hypothetical protein
MPAGAISEKVIHGARPAYPAATPSDYTSLSHACWAHDPALRPSFADIVRRLKAMSEPGLPT